MPKNENPYNMKNFYLKCILAPIGAFFLMVFALSPLLGSKPKPEVISPKQTKVVSVNSTYYMQQAVENWAKTGWTVKQIEVAIEIKSKNSGSTSGEIWTNKEIIIVFEK